MPEDQEGYSLPRENDYSAKEAMNTIFNSPSLENAFLGKHKSILIDRRERGAVHYFSSQGDYVWFLLGSKPCVTIADHAFSDKLFEIARSVKPQVKRADALVSGSKTGEPVLSKGEILYDPTLVRKRVIENKDVLKAVGFGDELLNNPDQFVTQVYSKGTSDVSDYNDAFPRQSSVALGVLYGYPITDAMLLEVQKNPEMYPVLRPFLSQKGIDLGLEQITSLKRHDATVRLYGSIATGWHTFGLTEESNQLADGLKQRFTSSGIPELIKEREKKIGAARRFVDTLSAIVWSKVKEIEYKE